ncbi:MAG: tetratricopeptide repeat protein [Deltaproteobacteria bacterium]|nr:tetratricopeptide repeat protein [Deltaproteobacteria bacterium]
MANKDKLVEKALKFVQKGYVDKAIKEYVKALEIDPNDIAVRLKVGDLYVKANKNSKAVKEYEEVANAHTKKGFYLKAIAVYKQIMKLEEVTVELHIKLADLYAKQRLIADAISEYSYIVNIYEKEGKTTEAFDLIKKMVDIDSENVGVKLKLADMHKKLGFDKDAYEEYCWIFEKLLSQGKLDIAEKILKDLYKNYSTEPRVLGGLVKLYNKRSDRTNYVKYAMNFANVSLEAGNEDMAKALCEAILKVSPGEVSASNLLRKFSVEPEVVDEIEEVEEIEEIEEVEDAELEPIEELEAVPEIPETVPAEDASVEEALIPEAAGLVFDEAAESVASEGEGSDSLPADLDIDDALDSLVSSWSDDEDDDTVEELKAGIGEQLSKEDNETHFNLGIAYMEMEMVEEAITEFKITLKSPGFEYEAKTRLGMSYMNIGDFDESIDFYKQAIEVENRSDDEIKGAMYELALVYEAAGRGDEAMETFKAVSEMDANFREVSDKLSGKSSSGGSDDVVEVELT